MAEHTETGGNAISAEVAARLIKVSPRRLQQLVSDGWIPRAGHGRYTVVGVVHGYLAYRDDLDARRAASAGQEDLRGARQREIEQRMAVRDRALIDIDEHDVVVDALLGIVKAELIGLPARVSRDKALRRTIESQIDGVLNRAAARAEQAASELRACGAAPAPAAEDDP